MSEQLIYDTGDREFERAVLERSKRVPVVVDFWAPWCGPCRVLGPLLERLAAEYNGAFVLAKVNVDENPGLAQAFGIQSIPMVIGFRDGQLAAEFVGALPESGVRDFLARVLPTLADEQAKSGSALLAAGDSPGAETAFRRALDMEPRHGGALIGLAEVLAGRDEVTEALELLDRVDPGPHRALADRMAARLRLQQTGDADEAALRRAIDAKADDVASRFQLGQVLAAAERYEEALQVYLEVVRRDRNFRDDAARKAMLDIFEILGTAHPLTDRYRGELAKVLFS